MKPENSYLFSLGVDPLYIVIAFGVIALACLILSIILLVKYSKLWVRYDIFMRGKNTISLEETINQIHSGLKETSEQQKTQLDVVKNLVRNERGAYKKIGLTQYDAFKEQGGKLSFSLCLLDDYDNGFIITVMHTSDGCYTYLKEVISGETIKSLSAEEKETLTSARNCDKLE